MFNPALLATEIFTLLRSFDYTVNIFDFDGNRVYEPDKARRFFATPRNITVSISEDGENSSLKLFLSQSTAIGEVEGLIETMRVTASKFSVLFNVRKYERELRPKDLAPNSNIEHEHGMSVIHAGAQHGEENKKSAHHLDNIKSELHSLKGEFGEIIAHLKKKNQKKKVKENMTDNAIPLEEKKGVPMIKLPALGCSVELDAWNAFKSGTLDLYSPPEEVNLPDPLMQIVGKLEAIANKVTSDGMSNMFRRVADALEHGSKDKLLLIVAQRAIAAAYGNSEEVTETRGPEMIELPALGLNVEKDAWEKFKAGQLELTRPVDFGEGKSGSYKLSQIAQACAADGMANMLAQISDDLETGNKTPLKIHIAKVAIAAAKNNGQANIAESIIVTESIRAYSDWFDSMTVDRLFEDMDDDIHYHRRNDDIDSAMDIAYKYVDENFNIDDFVDSYDAGEEKHTTISEVKTELKASILSELESAIDGDYPSSKDVARLVDEHLGEVKAALEEAGWNVTGNDGDVIEEGESPSQIEASIQHYQQLIDASEDCPARREFESKVAKLKKRLDDMGVKAVAESDELANEDVLLPKNAANDLTKEVTNNHPEEVETASGDEEDEDEEDEDEEDDGVPDTDVDRMLSLAKGNRRS